jgi:hypothetical protein
MRLAASNVFRERRGEEPRKFDYWKTLCMGLGIGILVCLIIATVVIINFDAEYPNQFTARGDPVYEKRSAAVTELVGWPLIFAGFSALMLVLASGGYLAYRVKSSSDLVKYATELDCIRPGQVVLDIDYAACAKKMGFSEKEVAVIGAQKKARSKATTNMIIVVGSILFAVILSVIVLVDW